ncbi:MAG TPA: DUF721 domain-containing protein [Salinivirgaceae bacterium]|nr:DUF721 domain-containing protein [Salinivirgaceae bacterium]
MRRQKTISLGQAIDEWINSEGIKRKIHQAQVINHWNEIVGDHIAKATQSLRIENDNIVVKFMSGLAMQEMLIIRGPLVNKINDQFGYQLIRGIYIEK